MISVSVPANQQHTDNTLFRMSSTTTKQDATLSQGGPRDAVVHFDRPTYQILQRHRAVSLPQHAFDVGLFLRTAVSRLVR